MATTTEGSVLLAPFSRDSTLEKYCRRTVIEGWKNIKRVVFSDTGDVYSAGEGYLVVGLKKDGSIVWEGTRPGWEGDFYEMEGAKTIVGGLGCIIGLMPGGRVTAVGNNEYGCCNIQKWNNISYVSSSEGTTCGVTNKGEFVYTEGNYTGSPIRWNNMKRVVLALFYDCLNRDDKTEKADE